MKDWLYIRLNICYFECKLMKKLMKFMEAEKEHIFLPHTDEYDKM